MEQLKRTPMYDEHLKLKGRIVPFAGWEMPVQYSGLIQEHECVRTKVGLFDVSHMGEFIISGMRAKQFLNRVTTNDIGKMTDCRCQYNLLCYENGTVVDDLIIGQIATDKYIAVVNASNANKDFDWLVSQNKEKVDLKDISHEKALIAIQGPLSTKLMHDLLGVDFSDLRYYYFRIMEHKGEQIIVSRTGYTGELGYELMVPWNKGAEYWRDAMAAGEKYGVMPIGLGARDTLRLEAAYSLYGHEISDKILPVEANLDWVIKPEKGDFIGRAPLMKAKEEGLKRRICGFEVVESGIARDGYRIFVGEEDIGYVTSGTYSPTLKKPVGLALVKTEYAELGKEFFVDVRGQKKKAVVVKTPFYKK